MQVVNQVRQTFGLPLKLQALFDAPTVAELSRVIVGHEARPGEAREIARITREVARLPAKRSSGCSGKRARREGTPDGRDDTRRGSCRSPTARARGAGLLKKARDRARVSLAGRGPARPAAAPPSRSPSTRLWFLDQLEPGSPVTSCSRPSISRGPLEAAALERSLEEILRRHEALRADSTRVDGEPRLRLSDGGFR